MMLIRSGLSVGRSEAPQESGATFSANFVTGDDLTKAEGGFSYSASNTGAGSSVLVTGNRLRFRFNDHSTDAWCEQRYTSGTQKYSELWSRMLVDIPADFVPSGGNAKGFFTQWSNTSGSNTEDGYSQANELLIGTELNPDGSGGWRPALRVFNSAASGYDINALSGGFYFPDGSSASIIPASAAGKTVEVVQMFKYSTVAGTVGNLNEDWLDDTPGLNGVVGLWSRIPAETSTWTEHYYKTNANLYPPSGVTGANRGYLWGWINGGFGQQLDLNVRENQFHTSDLWGIL